MLAAGIDVGGPRKGFHAVLLQDGRYAGRFHSVGAAEAADRVRQAGAVAVGIDAPCRWSPDGRMRAAERELAARGIRCFATPSRERAEGHGFYTWMHNGMELYGRLSPDYRLLDGRAAAAYPICFETFPQAIACVLAGRVLSARNKRSDRLALLEAELRGGAPGSLGPIDFIDAALCAYAAHRLLLGRCEMIGDARGGFIVLPDGPPGGR